jgi:Na+-translocating ferredoxin:NAD+ oxidoreductase RnfD subunit
MPDASSIAQSAPAPALPVRVCTLSGGKAQVRFYVLHMLGALFPLTAGDLLYGWRVPATLAVVLLSITGALLIWRKIGARGAALHLPHALWMGVLLTMMLPPHLLLGRDAAALKIDPSIWMILPAAALLLVMLIWLFSSGMFPRIYPLLLTYVTVVILFGGTLSPHLVLHRSYVFFGDLADADLNKPISMQVSREEAWVYLRGRPESTAMYVRKTAAERLSQYTRATVAPQREVISVDGLLRGSMPPLEDLVIGGHPGPIGASSAIAVIIGGLFLLYRGLIDYRVPLFVTGTALAAFLLLPIPVLITETSSQWRPLAFSHLDWPSIVTFANYELMASPLLLVSFFMASSRAVCPTTRDGVNVYAILLGLTAAAGQLYLSVAWGPYAALLLIGLLSRPLDAMFEESHER